MSSRVFIEQILTAFLTEFTCKNPLVHMFFARWNHAPFHSAVFPARSMIKEGPVQETQDPEKSNAQDNVQNNSQTSD